MRIRVLPGLLLAMTMNATAADPTFEELLASSHEYLQVQQQKLEDEYSLSTYERWNVDQETGELVFSNKGATGVIAKIQFVGSVSKTSQTWLWGWANESVLPGLTERIEVVRTYGEQHHFEALTERKWTAEEADGWDMAAITNYLIKGKGVYRAPAPSGQLFSFLVITDIRRAPAGKR